MRPYQKLKDLKPDRVLAMDFVLSPSLNAHATPSTAGWNILFQDGACSFVWDTDHEITDRWMLRPDFTGQDWYAYSRALEKIESQR